MAHLEPCPFCPIGTRPTKLIGDRCYYHTQHPEECKPLKRSSDNSSIVSVQLDKVKQVSDKMAKELKVYGKLRKKFLTENPYCAGNLQGCTVRATDVHHKRARGKYLLDSQHWLPMCRSCHTYVTESSEEAIRLGLSDRRNL